jgi:recombination protein RecA
LTFDYKSFIIYLYDRKWFMSMAKKPKEAIVASSNRQDAIRLAIAKTEQQFGLGSVRVLGDTKPVAIPRSSSGSLYLDDALGGGHPRGRIIEIIGPESSGKTTIALHAIAEIQKTGGTVLYIDAEHALDLNYAQALGVNTKELILSQPDTAEEALQIAELFMKSGAIDAFVVDSVAALVPKAELEGNIGDSHVGLLARLMSQTMRMMAGLIFKTGTTAIFINQLREKVGVMFGNPETTPGGRALKFYASVRIDVRSAEIQKIGEEAVSRKTRIKIIKSKVSVPLRVIEVDIEFGKGISKPGEILDIGTELGVVGKTGAWYIFDAETKVNGRPAAKAYLEANPEILDRYFNHLRELMTPVDQDEIEPPELGEMPEEALKDDVE